MSSVLIPPYGGKMVDLLVPPHEVGEVRAYASRLPSVLPGQGAIRLGVQGAVWEELKRTIAYFREVLFL